MARGTRRVNGEPVLEPADVARHLGINVKTVREYEAAGTIPAAQRTPFGHRYWPVGQLGAIIQAVMHEGRRQKGTRPGTPASAHEGEAETRGSDGRREPGGARAARASRDGSHAR